WSAWSVVRFWPKNADEAPKPSIVCLVSDQLTVMSCDFDPQAARLAERPAAMAKRDRFPIGATSSLLWRATEFAKVARAPPRIPKIAPVRAHGRRRKRGEVRGVKACR